MIASIGWLGAAAAVVPGRMLHVTSVLARLPAAGTERQMLGMLHAANGTLWNSRLAVLYPGGALVDEARRIGIDVVEGPAGPPWMPSRAAWARRLTRGTDCVHSQLHGANAFMRVVGVGGRRAPFVLAERRVEDFRGTPARLLDRALRGLADGWIANSHPVADFIARAHRVPRHEITVIPNGVDTARFRPRSSLRQPGPWQLGCVARLVEQKGIEIAIEAVRLLVQRGYDAHLTVVGEGPLRATLERAATGLPVRFMGALVDPDEVAELLRALDVFVFPSRYEGLPNAVLEAQACGLPVVATRAPGVAEALTTVARLVPVDDTEALAAAIAEELDAGCPPRPAGAARSFDDVAREHLEVFERAIVRRVRRA